MQAQPAQLEDLIAQVMALEPEGTSLEHLSDAVRTAARLGELAGSAHRAFRGRGPPVRGVLDRDRPIYRSSANRRRYKRFVPGDSDDLDVLATGRLSHFTPRARNAVRQARAEGAKPRCRPRRQRARDTRAAERAGWVGGKGHCRRGRSRRSAQGGHARRAPDE